MGLLFEDSAGHSFIFSLFPNGNSHQQLAGLDIPPYFSWHRERRTRPVIAAVAAEIYPPSGKAPALRKGDGRLGMHGERGPDLRSQTSSEPGGRFSAHSAAALRTGGRSCPSQSFSEIANLCRAWRPCLASQEGVPISSRIEMVRVCF